MPRHLAVALASGALLVSLLSPTAAASDPVDTGERARALPVAERSPRATVTFLAGLPRDRTSLDTAAVKRSTPGDLLYRDHPSLAEAAREFGAKDRAITRLRQAAEPLGITVKIDPGRLVARLTATVRDWERVYGTRITSTAPTAAYPYATFAFQNRRGYLPVPAPLEAAVREMVPLYAEYVASADTPGPSQQAMTQLAATLSDRGRPQRWPSSTGTVPRGTCDAPALQQRAVYAPGQIQQAYGTTALAASGVRGKGARVTIVSLGGGFVRSDIEAAAACFGYRQPPIDVVRGTGVPQRFVNGSEVTHLGLITASAVLPSAESIRLLQVPDSIVGFNEAFSRMLHGPQVPDAVAVPYGVCEAIYRGTFGRYASLTEDLLRMAAIVGTTVVVAAGDSGTSMCGAPAAEETGEPTAWYPASSRWVTAVGGTRLALKSDNTRRSERVWNDAPYVGSSAPPAPAGAGGPSLMFDRPWWQAGVTPAGPRMLPDVAVLGAIKPGWPIYLGGTLYTVGGTRGGTPFMAANLAAMSAKQRDRGFPGIGFANAWLYGAAAGESPPFFDVRRGSNGVQLVGCCSAYAGYDMASGLGAPAMDALYPTLPRPAG